MKVLLVNTLDKGGAANSCKRLHVSLLSKGLDSKVLLRFKHNDWPRSQQFIPKQKKLNLFQKFQNKLFRIAKELKLYRTSNTINNEHEFLKDRPPGLELFSFPNSDLDITESPLYQQADIINLHWVANFIDFESFFKKNTKPVVWTLHDMNPFTGGEHYLEEYLGIDDNGKPIRRSITDKEKIVSEEILQLKKEVMNHVTNLHVVTPSKWLLEEAQKSVVFNTFSIHHIPYGLDPETFKILDKAFARSLFNIPNEKRMILFVADSIDNQRKGFTYIKRAIEKFDDRDDLVLCAIGSTGGELMNHKKILNLGEIKDERLMAAAFNAADVFVVPSLMDNLPNTILESLMCGTPVIGFPAGGIKEMIRNEENGILTHEISVSALVDAISSFLADPERFSKEAIRATAAELYDERKQSGKYIELYDKILEG